MRHGYAHDAIITSRIEQTHQANQWWRGDDPRMEVGQKAYLSTENLNLPKARARKLMPKYIGPYEIISCKRENSHSPYQTSYSNKEYTLRSMPNCSNQQSQTTTNTSPTGKLHTYGFGDNPEREWLVDSIVNHKFTKNSINFDILWDTGETTCEPLATAWNEAYIMLVSCIDYALDMTCIQSVSQCFIVGGIL